MPLRPNVPANTRWYITEKGRQALDCRQFCDCDVRLSGILFCCEQCGTVYGSIKEATSPRAQRWTYTKWRA